MPTDPFPSSDPAAAAARASLRAERRAAGAMADFFLSHEARLEERTRVVLARVLDEAIGALDLAIRRHAARLLGDGRPDDGAARLMRCSGAAARIVRPGLLPADLLEELIARVRHDVIAQALPLGVTEPDAPSLLVRLAGGPDTVIAAASAALLAAENRRQAGEAGGGDLPGDLHHRLAWLVAAALHDTTGADADTGHALVEATRRAIAAHDGGERLEAVAMRLAIAIDARSGEIGVLLADALCDRRLALFVAVVARALAVDFAQVRGIVVEPDDDRLWLALRAIGLQRAEVARIALALADADPRRDIGTFADRLDEIAAITPEVARAALAGLTLPAEFRAASRALAAA